MAGHKKPTPERYCEYCGKKLERKRLPNGDLEYLIWNWRNNSPDNLVRVCRGCHTKIHRRGIFDLNVLKAQLTSN